MSSGFELDEIAASLNALYSRYAEVSSKLTLQRETLTAEMVDNMLDAYTFLNDLLTQGMDVFTPAGMHGMLELNHLVLCGNDPKTRSHYYSHIAATRKRFLKSIRPISSWVLKRRKRNNDPFELAAGFYSRVLSYPQLFLEGNHRTGNILLNYLLISAGTAPYVPGPEDAHMYLNLSGDFKLSEKDNSFDTALNMPRYRRSFEEFLREYGSERFVRGGVGD